MLVGNLVAESLSVNGVANMGRAFIQQNDPSTIGLDVIGASSSGVSIARIRDPNGNSVFEIDGAGRILSPFNAGDWRPSDQNMIAWTMNPAACTASGTTLSLGYIYFIQVILRAPTTITNLCAVIGTAGSGLTSGQCLAGLYTSGGTRVGVTADLSTTWNSSGDKTMALTSPYSAAAGKYYVAFLVNGSTSPTFACGSTLGASFTPGNARLTSGNYRFCRSGSGQTSLPSSFTMTSATPDANNVWAAVA
ncbi:hypothetical protein ACWD25_22160 [Streptomyces sp. NPDC002920]